jgi:hypothetical protein
MRVSLSRTPQARWGTRTGYCRLDEAHSAVKAGLALNPAFAMSRFRANLAARCEDQRFLAQLEPILEGMRKAGLPEE